MNQAVDFGLLLGGGVLLVSVFSGRSLSQVLSGQPATPTSTPTGGGGVITGAGKAITGAVGSATGTGTGTAPSGSVVGLVTWADLAAIGAAHGWTGSQLTDWANVIKAESNGTLSDTNSSSGAYGIAQFINGPSEYATWGGNATTVTGQLTAMANYIASRYHTPSAAWSFHLANNWY